MLRWLRNDSITREATFTAESRKSNLAVPATRKTRADFKIRKWKYGRQTLRQRLYVLSQCDGDYMKGDRNEKMDSSFIVMHGKPLSE